ncbi:beta-glucosidase [Wenxinia marina]|uniref:Beta-D-glucoside glucohydrolase n=1 Tax=Wenxinia marina DSM 24838 TaxID=1123501 RepID=A0A0D0Q9U0_9RHOB|nr:glycoside hydrolase family 3 C-terminal domain-containing protein [Wenxinia marina]KIQ67783.1 Beta-glucosidase-related glycosidase [Wenxinia marina DSM 24838]GGL77261.1 glycosyl hydrolase [Wenxinia marina]
MTDTDLDSLLDRMTLEEQVSLLSGEDIWSLPAIPRLNIGKLRVTDGPNGARGSGSLVGGVTAAAFPVGIAIGATWDPELAREIGAAIAEEVKSKGAHVSLAPTVNIHRSVTNGRNFECYSEDPELAAQLTAGYVTGLQSGGVAATVKHFAGNESEIERTTINSEIPERALREIYLRPFEAAVKEAGTWAVMSSYNKLNGTYTAENYWLLTEVLRDDWGFDGVVMSDWFGSRTTAPTVNAGLDLEMPGPTRDRGPQLIAAVEAGEVSRETIRERARNILRLMARTGALHDDRPFEERANDRPDDRALIRRAGAEGTVLLKNEGVLPLAEAPGTVAVIGPNAKVAQIMGGGSAQLNPHYRVSPWDGLVERLGADVLTYAKGCDNHRWEPLIEGGLTIDYFDSTDWTGPAVHSETMEQSVAFLAPPYGGGKVDPRAFTARVTGSFTAEADGPHRFGLHAAGYGRLYVDGALVVDAEEGAWAKGRTFFEEGNDEVTGTVDLAAGQTVQVTVEVRPKTPDNLDVTAFRFGVSRPLGDADIAEAVRIAGEAETAILFVGRSGEWDTEGSDLDGIELPGRQAELVEAVLAANPNAVIVLQTGGPVEMPWIGRARAVLQAWYPGQEAGNAIVDVLFGDAEPGGRLPQTFPVRVQDNPTWSQDPEVYPGLDGKVRYEEGVFIGQRHYDRHGITPLFPFGHGLSYTSFALSDLSAEASDEGSATARLTVTNTGDRAGSTVVQLYVGDPDASVPRPVRELKGFAKVRLDAGASAAVEIALPPRAFAFYDVTTGAWMVEEGRFTLEAGLSATDLPLRTELELGGRTLPR